jgi:3-hydroxyacyl-[acyl-carrier-protein] dehydratase
MLLTDFYTADLSSSGAADTLAGTYLFRIELQENHPVYKGHFPGNPVVPGVCQVQMISEMAEQITGKKLLLMRSDNIKFLSMMVPGTHRNIDGEITLKEGDTGDISISAILRSGEITFIKYKGMYRSE